MRNDKVIVKKFLPRMAYMCPRCGKFFETWDGWVYHDCKGEADE